MDYLSIRITTGNNIGGYPYLSMRNHADLKLKEASTPCFFPWLLERLNFSMGYLFYMMLSPTPSIFAIWPLGHVHSGHIEDQVVLYAWTIYWSYLSPYSNYIIMRWCICWFHNAPTLHSYQLTNGVLHWLSFLPCSLGSWFIYGFSVAPLDLLTLRLLSGIMPAIIPSGRTWLLLVIFSDLAQENK